MKILTVVGVFMMLAVTPALAQDGVPDLPRSEAWMSYEGPGTPTLMVQPDGQGPTFQQAQLEDGTQVECIIYLRVLDWNENPVINLPAEDMWLESWDGGMDPCGWDDGTQADQATDEDGLTFWVEPVHAGGYSQEMTAVYINGDNVLYDGGLNLHFNSPDINGDREVNLYDVSLFASDLFGEYHFQSDLYRDSRINLADVGRMASAMGAGCP